MLKRMFKIGCVALVLGMTSAPAWSLDGADMGAGEPTILARGGHGPGDGTGNGGSGPGDGTGNGSRSGDCPNLKTDVNEHLPLMAGRGNGGGRGSGGNGGGRDSGGNGGGRDSGGNGGVCPWGA